MEGMPSVQIYNRIKEWGANTEAYSFSICEEGRLGRLVPERYLDDRDCLKDTRLKLLCRLNCLPVMDRVGREAQVAETVPGSASLVGAALWKTYATSSWTAQGMGRSALACSRGSG